MRILILSFFVLLFCGCMGPSYTCPLGKDNSGNPMCTNPDQIYKEGQHMLPSDNGNVQDITFGDTNRTAKEIY